MGFGKGSAKEKLVEFGKTWILELTSLTPFYSAEFGSDFGTGVQNRQFSQAGSYPIAVELSPHDIYIKADILSYNILSLAQCFFKFFKYLLDRYALFGSQLCGDPMDTFCIVGNGKVVRGD